MKSAFACAALAAMTMMSAPVAAQNYGSQNYGSQNYRAQNYNQWDSNEFWRGAPTDASQRIGFLRQRIARGRQDGSLTRGEAVRAERQLRQIEREAWQMRRRYGGRMSPADSDRLQARLDNLSRNLRWMRHNGAGYGAAGYGNGSYGDRGVDNRFVTNYDARAYYRDDPRYQERTLSAQDEVYRGSDGRYYCKRNDGTTGLIVGGVGGAVLGNVIDGGHNRVAGTLIGGALGALLGKTVDQNRTEVRCR